MFIHYISCHSVLEYDEVKLLTELGYDVFANGAYRDPKGAYTLPRPGIPTAKFYPDLFDMSAVHPKTNLPPEMIEPFDAIIVMHSPEVLFQNWQRIKHKRVIWRSIGQSTASLEQRLQPLVAEGLEIIRYSPMEQGFPNFAGSSALIRFYKDPQEFGGWNGDSLKVINFTQALLGRRYFTHYDEIVEIMRGFDSTVYGTGNDDLGNLNGGEVPYELQKKHMRDARVYVYGGTWPACYTLSIMEAMMTGIPVVSLGRGLVETDRFEQLRYYEIPDIITHGVNGFVSDNITELRACVQACLDDKDFAKKIGDAGRDRAIELFGRESIAKQWQEYLGY